jgi:hypothetical protein
MNTSEPAVEALGRRHARRQGVEAHASVADLARRIDHRLGQPAANAMAAPAGLDP